MSNWRKQNDNFNLVDRLVGVGLPCAGLGHCEHMAGVFDSVRSH